MSGLLVVRWVHLLAAATWTGGLIALGALVFALRREGADRETLRAAARAFAKVGWTAMALAIVTGLWQVQGMALPWSYARLHVKLGMVALTIAIAAFHQLTAGRTSPAVRGIFELAVLMGSLGIFAAAVAL